MAARRRLDLELTRRGLAPSREAARRLIADRQVLVSGSVADKPARQVAASEDVRLLGPAPRFVSRAGAKLEAALDEFAIDVGGLRALDAGSSTGGFTDCLLQQGARRVIAVDVGTHQLHERLRSDRRVEIREQTDIRSLGLADLGEDGPVDLVVGDLSFISLRKVLPTLDALASPAASLVLLVKPQFEAGRIEVSRGRGVITDPDIWLRTFAEVAETAALIGRPLFDASPSPITGTTGNVEFLARFARPEALAVDEAPAHEGLIERAVARAEGVRAA